MSIGPRAHLRGMIAGLLVYLLPSIGFALSPSRTQPDVSSLLLQQTQKFSEAGQRGDGVGIAPYLDNDVIFINETGEMASKADLTANGPPAPGLGRTITTTDWSCKVHDNVAVSSFVDVVEQGKPGHRMRSSYRSVETWLKEGNSWKMIGSETLTLHQDPPSMMLLPQVLQQYTGFYVASSGLRFTLKLQGEGLVVSIAGGPSMPERVEAPDILFVPGSALREVFQRDSQRRISGFILLGGARDARFRRAP